MNVHAHAPLDPAARSLHLPARARALDPWLECLQRIGERDEQALTSLLDGTRAHVYAVAYRVLSRPAEAEEVTLDVYMQVWRTAQAFDRQRGTVLAWLTTIARSRAIDRLRTLRWREAPATYLPDLTEVRTSSPDPEQALLLRHRRRHVGTALRRLPVRQRRPIRLAFVAGRSHQQVAASLGMPLGTVKTRIRLGLKRMSPMLAGAV